jgi:hypothetical protein
VSDHTDLGNLTRDQLDQHGDPMPAAVVRALDEWVARTHGVLGGAHQAGLFLDLLADAGYQVVPSQSKLLTFKIEFTPEESAEFNARFKAILKEGMRIRREDQ